MLLCILLNLGMLSGESALHLDCIYIITPDRRKSKMLLIIVEATNDNQKLSFLTFLAHLSRRLMGELIVYQSLRRPSVRPSVVRPSTFSNIFSSETTWPIELKFHMETP